MIPRQICQRPTHQSYWPESFLDAKDGTPTTPPTSTSINGPTQTLNFGPNSDFERQPIPRKPKTTLVTPDNKTTDDLVHDSSDDNHAALVDLKIKRALTSLVCESNSGLDIMAVPSTLLSCSFCSYFSISSCSRCWLGLSSFASLLRSSNSSLSIQSY
jgi:hypothetical protein